MGSRRRWARWVLTLGALVSGLRLAFAVMLPLLPDPVAWGSAVALGAALTLFLLPLPHEATLGSGAPRPRDRPDADPRR